MKFCKCIEVHGNLQAISRLIPPASPLRESPWRVDLPAGAQSGLSGASSKFRQRTCVEACAMGRRRRSRCGVGGALEKVRGRAAILSCALSSLLLDAHHSTIQVRGGLVPRGKGLGSGAKGMTGGRTFGREERRARRRGESVESRGVEGATGRQGDRAGGPGWLSAMVRAL